MSEANEAVRGTKPLLSQDTLLAGTRRGAEQQRYEWPVGWETQ